MASTTPARGPKGSGAEGLVPAAPDTAFPHWVTLAFFGALALLAVLAFAAYGVVRTLNERTAFDAAQLNYAGRQRMLAQRIARAAVSTVAASDPAALDAALEELSESRSQWKQGDTNLRVGNAALGLAPLASSDELRDIVGLRPAFAAVDGRVDDMLGDARSAGRDARWRSAMAVTEACDAYIAGMETLVSRVQRESESHARRVNVAATWMVAMALLLLAAEGVLVFRPLVRRLRASHETLAMAYAQVRDEMALRERVERERDRLEGLLPICASCKCIRDTDGTWRRLEQYIEERTEAQFTHGLCEACVRKLYPEQAAKLLG